jgi:hypothetical protein
MLTACIITAILALLVSPRFAVWYLLVLFVIMKIQGF